MALVDQLERQGERLFSARSWWPLPVLVVLALAMGADPAPRAGWWLAVCVVVSCLGAAVRAATIGCVPAGTSGRNTRRQVAERLNTTGTYSVVRHPLYVGNFLMGLGVALYTASWTAATIFALAFWLYFERVMLAEERFLADAFGEEFERWADATPAFVPDPRAYRPAELGFSLSTVLRREYNGVYAVVASLFGLEAVRGLAAGAAPPVSNGWGWTMVVATALWLGAMGVKRGTSWLRVSGRP